MQRSWRPRALDAERLDVKGPPTPAGGGGGLPRRAPAGQDSPLDQLLYQARRRRGLPKAASVHAQDAKGTDGGRCHQRATKAFAAFPKDNLHAVRRRAHSLSNTLRRTSDHARERAESLLARLPKALRARKEGMPSQIAETAKECPSSPADDLLRRARRLHWAGIPGGDWAF
eukprot:CAMPEP_0197935416 /NCGR_PEP_ID=MMETSP1439-20131203/113301_1 /TAXON_ID=66791 /ORGANISM="Gonyaulax spinifera, Strain CCMP409" /LENGTH=171 /DNA_ID=CAMNT_0043558355 /DNA_START=51 /DNA_END=566 /DNA_ORIENTATION=-